MSEGLNLLLHSGWQGINIGDIAHSPGALRVLQRRYPEAQLWYWPRSPYEPAEQMIGAAFPQLRIVRGEVGADGKPTTDQLREAFEQVDVFIHGSGGGLSGKAGTRAFHNMTGKPYGFLGTGAAGFGEGDVELFAAASFVYTRETQSAKNLHAAGVTGPEVRFVPDGTFACDLREDAKALAYREANGLDVDGYICVIPRLRYTPYHRLRDVPWSEEKIAEVEGVNEANKEKDHAKLREAIVRWVRETGRHVLLCPEMAYQTELIDPLLYEPLPDDVKPHVVRRLDYWRTDEAASTYRDACAVISIECHSPILALEAGTPAFYVRQPEDTIKGQMYYDLGLSDWVFEIDQIEGRDIADRLMQVHGDQAAAERKRAAAIAEADRLFASIDIGL